MNVVKEKLFDNLLMSVQNHSDFLEEASIRYSEIEEILFKKEKEINDYELLYKFLTQCHPAKSDALCLAAVIMKFVKLPPLYTIFRYGNSNEHLYLNLKGNIGAFFPRELHTKMTEEEYVLYLLKLYHHNELLLLEKTIALNKIFGIAQYTGIADILAKFQEKISKFADEGFKGDIELSLFDDLLLVEKTAIKISESNFYNYFLCLVEKIKRGKEKKTHSIENYITNVLPVYSDKDLPRESCVVYIYTKENFVVKSGDWFNKAFSRTNCHGATVFTQGDVTLGYIHRDYFDLPLIKDNFEINKAFKYSALLSHPFFANVNEGYFDRNFMEYLGFEKNKKNDLLVVAGTNPEESKVYFVKKGKLEVFYKNKLICRIENSDVVGCDDYITKAKYFLTVKVVSDETESYTINYSDLLKMTKESFVFRTNYLSYIRTKMELMAKRVIMCREKEEISKKIINFTEKKENRTRNLHLDRDFSPLYLYKKEEGDKKKKIMKTEVKSKLPLLLNAPKLKKIPVKRLPRQGSASPNKQMNTTVNSAFSTKFSANATRYNESTGKTARRIRLIKENLGGKTFNEKLDNIENNGNLENILNTTENSGGVLTNALFATESKRVKKVNRKLELLKINDLTVENINKNSERVGLNELPENREKYDKIMMYKIPKRHHSPSPKPKLRLRLG